MKNLFIETDFQKEWIEKLEKLESSFKSHAQDVDENARFPKENIQDLIDIGYTKLTLPEKYGGTGLKITDLILFQETIASYCGTTALSIGWHMGVTGELFEKELWPGPILERFAQDMQEGALVNRILSEFRTGSPTRGGQPGTTAVLDGDEWVINGRKNFSTMSPVLTHFAVSAWIEEKEAIGFFLVERERAGLSIEETWDVIAMRGTESHDVILENVRIPKDQLVEISSGPRNTGINAWALHIPATYLGIAQAARDYALSFATSHSPNSIKGTISELPNVQHTLGEIELLLTNARHFLYSVAGKYDNPNTRDKLTNELGAAKHIVTNTAVQVVDKAMRIVGAKSLQRSNPLQRYYRDVRAGLHNPPMDDMTIAKLAQTAIQTYKK